MRRILSCSGPTSSGRRSSSVFSEGRGLLGRSMSPPCPGLGDRGSRRFPVLAGVVPARLLAGGLAPLRRLSCPPGRELALERGRELCPRALHLVHERLGLSQELLPELALHPLHQVLQLLDPLLEHPGGLARGACRVAERVASV